MGLKRGYNNPPGSHKFKDPKKGKKVIFQKAREKIKKLSLGKTKKL